MAPEQTLSFVREHGVVLASAKGKLPNLAQAIAGEPIQGSWWSHAKGKMIFALFHEIETCEDILICRAAGGKITLIHRRLWPALVRLAHRFPTENLAQIHQVHTEAGHHENRTIAFPAWVPPDIRAEAMTLSEQMNERSKRNRCTKERITVIPRELEVDHVRQVHADVFVAGYPRVVQYFGRREHQDVRDRH